MNKKKFYYIIFFILSISYQNVRAQGGNLQVLYRATRSFTEDTYELIVNDTIAYWHRVGETQVLDNEKGFDEKYKNMPNVHVAPVMKIEDPDSKNSPYKDFIVKSYKDSLAYVLGAFKRENFVYEDSLYPMKWVPVAEHRFIMGYECLGAETYFRGRKYKVFYAPQIPVKEGPWKFGGLPGLILEVENDVFKYKAIKLTLHSDQEPDLPPLYQYPTMTWEEYVKRTRERFDKIIAKIRADKIRRNSFNPSTIKIIAQEIIHPVFSKEGYTISPTENKEVNKPEVDNEEKDNQPVIIQKEVRITR